SLPLGLRESSACCLGTAISSQLFASANFVIVSMVRPIPWPYCGALPKSHRPKSPSWRKLPKKLKTSMWNGLLPRSLRRSDAFKPAACRPKSKKPRSVSKRLVFARKLPNVLKKPATPKPSILLLHDLHPQLCNLLTHSLFRHPIAPDRQS